jgi:hypothetical protein
MQEGIIKASDERSQRENERKGKEEGPREREIYSMKSHPVQHILPVFPSPPYSRI